MNHLYTNHKRKISRRLSWVILLACLPLLCASGQNSVHEIKLDVPRIVPISPEASSMERYQSYPVDYCTGVPNISIPLYEIVAGEVTIPVTLSYHASGLKPKERSGLAGTGWTLSLEPSIMREIKGTADDSGWFRRLYDTPPVDERARFQYYADMVDNIRDTQPDKFVYKLPHGGGSGYFRESTHALSTIPLTNDRVYYHGSSMDATDANGIQYLFDGIEKAGNFITRWLCTSIRSPRRVAPLVTFDYNTIRGKKHPNAYFNLDAKVIINDIESSSPHVVFTEQTAGGNQHYRVDVLDGTQPYDTKRTYIPEAAAGVRYPHVNSFTNELAIESRLDKIHFFGNTLSVFYTSTGTSDTHSDVYQRIEVTDAQGTVIRTIEFVITPYNSSTSLTSLDAVRISAPGSETKEYTFRYKNSSQVPAIFTTAVDHWGFCNGAYQGSDRTVPSFKHQAYMPLGNLSKGNAVIEYSGANREPSAEFAQAGILNRITDPQGIQTIFAYEGNCGAFRDDNRSNGYDDYLHPVGGVRVKSIETYDPHTQDRTTKIYKYGLTKLGNTRHEPVWGGGAIKHIVSQRDYCSYMSAYNTDRYGTYSYFEYMTTYVSMPQSNITFSNGSAVIYNIVSEEIYGKGLDSLKTDYYYFVEAHPFEGVLRWDTGETNIVKHFFETKPAGEVWKIFRHSPFHPQEPSDDLMNYPPHSGQYNGRISRKNCFNAGELVSRTDYSYNMASPNSSISVYLPIRTLLVDAEVYMNHPSSLDGREVYAPNCYYTPSSGSSQLQTGFFLEYDIFYTLDQETNTEYFTVNNRRDSLVTEKKYTYDTHAYGYGYSMEPKKVETRNSDGNMVADEYKYLRDFPAILSYHKRSEGARSTESRIQFKAGTCFPERIQSKTDRLPDFCDEVVYTAYDSHDNVAEIKGKDGTPVTFLWGYLNRFPIAKIENATRAEVLQGMGYPQTSTNVPDAWSGFIRPSEDIWNMIHSLRGSLPDARVTTYEYDPVKGVTAVTDPNKVVTHFEYDHYNRLTDSYYLDPDLKRAMLQRNIYHFEKPE